MAPPGTTVAVRAKHLIVAAPTRCSCPTSVSVLRPSLRKQSAYNARMDRLDAIRLLKALVAAGAKPRVPMDSAWMDKIALRDVSLHGTQLASALAYAEGEGWLVDSPRKGWVSLTRAGEIVARQKMTVRNVIATVIQI